MTVADLQALYGYGYWANRKLFSVLEQLTPEQFVRPVAASYDSIRNTPARNREHLHADSYDSMVAGETLLM